MYYDGMSLQGIQRLLQQEHRSYVSDSSIYSWLVRFTNEAIIHARKTKPNLGDEWICYETMLKIEGDSLWFWDCIDAGTHFLLASHISRTRTTGDAGRFLEKASERAERSPRKVITDKPAVYLASTEIAFGVDTKHIQGSYFNVDNDTDLIESFQGILKSRTKLIRRLKKVASAKLFAEGWSVHYNFLRSNESLDGKTPAEAAGIKFPFRNWKEMITAPHMTFYHGLYTEQTITIKPEVPEMPITSFPPILLRSLK
jgi:transposase-like protein